MKRWKQNLLAAGLGVGMMASNAHAAFTMPTAAAIDLGPVEAWLGVAVVAYLALMGYRKFIKSANRS